MPDEPKRKAPKGNSKLFYPLLAISVAATIICGAGVISELHTRGQSQSYYTALSVAVDAAEAAPSSEAAPGGGDAPAPEPTAQPWRPYLDFASTREQIPDLRAWIRCPGTNINYPVVQGADNDYYLKHLPNGSRNKMGSIFLDHRNAADFTDKNTLIYGHHIKHGEMFGVLSNYYQQEFYDAHPVITIHTPEKDFELALFTGYVLDSGRETPPLTFADEADFMRYVADIQRRSVFQSAVEIGPDDRIICLCTCAYAFENARLIIVGKLME